MTHSYMIDDEGVPLADSVAQTGDKASAAPVTILGILMMAAGALIGKRNKEDKQINEIKQRIYGNLEVTT